MKIINDLIELLGNNGLTISFCESASGGALSNLITSVNGSSKIFKGSIIAYSNDAKKNIVKVPEHIINEKGAVSKETAEYMAYNTNKLFNTSICISITGNSATTNLQEDKPSGLYYVGVTIIDKTYTYEVKLESKERNYNRLEIATKSLSILNDILRECLH